MRTLFHGGRLFDGTGAPAAPADVVVEEGRVVDVGPGLDGDESVDCTGLLVLPGLFDCHVHVIVSRVDMLRELATPFSYQFYEAATNLALTLATGITTVRDASGADLGVKQAVEDGLVAGPRMQISIAMISQTGGHGDGWGICGAHVPSPYFDSHPGRPSGVVDGPEEMRRKVRELIRAGADVIKVATSGGVLSPRDDPRHGHLRDDELEMLVSEATAAGRFVMAHAQATDGIKGAIRAGIRSIEHGIYLDDEAISMMLDRGVWLVPTLVAAARRAGGRRPRRVYPGRDGRQGEDGARRAHRLDPPCHRRGCEGRDGDRLGSGTARREPARAVAHGGVRYDAGGGDRGDDIVRRCTDGSRR